MPACTASARRSASGVPVVETVYCRATKAATTVSTTGRTKAAPQCAPMRRVAATACSTYKRAKAVMTALTIAPTGLALPTADSVLVAVTVSLKRSGASSVTDRLIAQIHVAWARVVVTATSNATWVKNATTASTTAVTANADRAARTVPAVAMASLNLRQANSVTTASTTAAMANATPAVRSACGAVMAKCKRSSNSAMTVTRITTTPATTSASFDGCR